MANYLYNGVELPQLPEWDKTTYPYAFIVAIKLFGAETVLKHLYVTSSPLEYYKVTEKKHSYLKATANGSGARYYYEPPNMTEWEFGEDVVLVNGEAAVSYDTPISQGSYIMWCNYDMYNYEQDTIYLPASYPIDAETGEEIHDYEIGSVGFAWKKHDAYKPNTEWDGKTFYRVMGGKWVKQDAVAPSE